MANHAKIHGRVNPSSGSVQKSQPVIPNTDIKISEFEKAWKSVDEIKAGLQRTEKKLKSIGKEPWDALIDIPAFSSSSTATEIPHDNMYPDRDYIQERQSNTNSHRSATAQVPRPSVRKISRLNSARTHNHPRTLAENQFGLSPDELSFLKQLDRRSESSRKPLQRVRHHRHQHHHHHHRQSEEEEDEEDEDIFGDRRAVPSVVRSNVGGMFMPSWPSSSSSLSSGVSPEPENQDSDVAFLTDPVSSSHASPPNPGRPMAGFDHHSPRPPEQQKPDAMPVPLRTSRSLPLQTTFASRLQQPASGFYDAFGEQKNIASWPELAPTGPSDGLRKLKELIEHQKQQLAATTRVHSAPATARGSSQVENDVSPSRGCQGPKAKAPPVRKVAPAPAVPVYRGFSRNQQQQEQMSPEKRTKDLQNGITRKLRKPDKGLKHPRTKKVVKITANIQDFIICPTSWRKGQELILRELGPFKLPNEETKNEEEKSGENSFVIGENVGASKKVEDDVNNSHVITPSSAKEESTIATQTSFSHLDTDRTNEVNISSKKSVGESFSPPERDKSPSSYDTSEKAKDKTLANNIRSILNADLSDKTLDKANDLKTKTKDTNREMSSKLALQKNLTKSPSKNRSPNKRKKDSKQTVTEKRQQPTPKVRHYDPETVRSYISKQKAERTKKLQEEKQKKLQETQQRNQKLQELQQRQKQLAKASIRKRVNTQGELVDCKYDSSDSEDFDQHSSHLTYLPPEAKQYKKSAEFTDKPNAHYVKKSFSKEKNKSQQPATAGPKKTNSKPKTILGAKTTKKEQINTTDPSQADNSRTVEKSRQEKESLSSRIPSKEKANLSKIIDDPKKTKTVTESDVSPYSVEDEELRSDNSPLEAHSETTSSLSLGSFGSPVSNPVSNRSKLDYLQNELPHVIGASSEEVLPVLEAASSSIERKLFLTNLAVSCQETVDQMIRKLKSYLPQEIVEDSGVPTQSFIGNNNKSKMQRLEMLRTTAESLQQKISEETTRIKNSMHGTSSIPLALLSGSPEINEPIELLGGIPGLGAEEPDYLGAVGGNRNQPPNAGQGEASGMASQPGPSHSQEPSQDRVRKGRSQLSVFEGNLPGIGSLLHHAQAVAEQQKQENAAMKIQAAYRGYRVRKSLKWRLPLGNSLAAHIFKLPNPKSSFETNKNIKNKSSFSERSSDLSVSKPKEFGKNLFSVDYCASTVIKPKHKDENLFQLQQQHSPNLLEDIVPSETPEPDPYNFINTLTRRLQQGDKWIGFPSLKRSSIDSNISNISRPMSIKDAAEDNYRDDFESVSSPIVTSLSKHSSIPADGEAAEDQHLSSITITTPVSKSSNSNLEKSIAFTIEHSAPSLSKSEAGSQNIPHTSTPAENNNQKRGDGASIQDTDVDEFTLSEGPLSEKSESSLSQGSLPSSSFSGESPNTSPSSTSSSIHQNKEETSLEEQLLEDENPQAEANDSPQSSQKSEQSVDKVSALLNSQNVVLQYTPNALHLRLNAELTYLDSLEEGLRQITDVERIRSVSLAQQETVAISQILQSEQHKWSEEVKKMSKMMSQEAEARQQAITEMQKQYEKAVEAAAKSKSKEIEAVNTTTQKLLETQTEAVRTTAEAAKQLAEAKVATLDLTSALQLQTANQMATETAAAAAVAAVTKVFDAMKHHKTKESIVSDNSSSSRSSRSRRSYSPPKESSDKYSKSVRQPRMFSRNSLASPPSSISESIHNDRNNFSPIHNEAESTLEGGPLPTEQQSLSEGSIPEELDEASEYSDKFEDSNSDSQTKDKSKGMPAFQKNSSLSSISDEKIADNDEELDQVSLSTDTSASEIQDDVSTSQTLGLSSQNSFNKFTLQMLRQYMKEEEMRSKHQLSLLKLREKSLIEKTKAELAWLEVQKQQLREKGDDKLPAIRKKQRGLMLRLQQEQAEIRRLREAQKIASQERQMLLQQQQHVAQLRHSTRNILGRIREVAPGMSSLKVLTNTITPTRSHETSPKPMMMRPDSSSDAVPTDEELSLALDDSQSDNVDEASSRQLSKSEILSETKVKDQEPKEGPIKSGQSLENDILQGLKKLNTSKRYLNKREQKLFQRRKEIEELLIWRQKLDKEEAQIKAMEKQVVTLMELEKTKKQQGIAKSQGSAKHAQEASEVDGRIEVATKENMENDRSNAVNQNSPNSSQIPEEITASSLAEQEAKSSGSVPLDSKLQSNHSGSESSITEDVPNATQTNSIAEDIVAENVKSSPDLLTRTSSAVDYGGDSFEASSNSTVKPKLESKVKRSRSPSVSLRLPLSPRTHVHKRRDSSGSDESVTVSHSETASDVSDIEGRIHALKEELKQRKVEAERLRREQKRRNRERMRVQEASLLKQIEAYDRFILQTKAELERELELEAQLKVSVKPQIRQPKVAESRHLTKLSTSPPSNKVTENLPDEESHPHQLSTHASPINTPREDSVGSPSEPVSISSKRTSLESIDESLEGTILDADIQPTNKSEAIDIESDFDKVELNNNFQISLLEDSKVDSDNDDSTSDSVKTVTELGDAKIDSKPSLEQLTEKADSGNVIEAEIDKIEFSSEDEKNKILIRQTSQSELSEQIPEDLVEADDIWVNVSNVSSPHSLENENEETKKTEDKTELGDIEQIGLSGKETEKDETVSEIEEYLTETFEEIKTSEDETEKSSTSVGPATDVISVILQETHPEIRSPGTAETDDNKISNVLSKDEKYFSQLEVKADYITDILIEGILKEALKCYAQAKMQIGKRKIDAVSLNFRNAVLEEKAVSEEENLQDKKELSSLTDSPLEIAKSKEKHEEIHEVISTKLSESLFRESLDVMFNIYFSLRLFTPARIREELAAIMPFASPPKTSVSQRVADILSEIDRRSSQSSSPKDKPSPQDILSLSSPTAYSDVLSLSEGSSPTLGSPVKDLAPRPSSPVLGEPGPNAQADFVSKPLSLEGDDLLESELLPDQEWIDDDLGLENQAKMFQIYPFQQYYYIREIPNKPPPPYTPPGSITSSNVQPQPTLSRIDLKRSLQPEPFFAVPHTRAEVSSLVRNTLDRLGDASRQQLDEASPTAHLLDSGGEEDGGDTERQCRQAYVGFVFDLTKELLAEVRDAAEPEPSCPLWTKPKWPSRRKIALLSRDSSQLADTIERNVLKLIGLTPSPSVTPASSALTLGRKKQDIVDEILVSELREEEIDWITYDEDELGVKNHIANSIFDCLLSETAVLLKTIYSKHSNTVGPER